VVTPTVVEASTGPSPARTAYPNQQPEPAAARDQVALETPPPYSRLIRTQTCGTVRVIVVTKASQPRPETPHLEATSNATATTGAQVTNGRNQVPLRRAMPATTATAPIPAMRFPGTCA
jgi:hypothetical protein